MDRLSKQKLNREAGVLVTPGCEAKTPCTTTKKNMTNCFIHVSRRLCVTQGFIKRSPMFRRIQKTTHVSTSDLVEAAKVALKSGRLKPGDPFPNADEISDLSGARLDDSLSAVTNLLRAGYILQDASGKLIVAPPEAA